MLLHRSLTQIQPSAPEICPSHALNVCGAVPINLTSATTSATQQVRMRSHSLCSSMRSIRFRRHAKFQTDLTELRLLGDDFSSMCRTCHGRRSVPSKARTAPALRLRPVDLRWLLHVGYRLCSFLRRPAQFQLDPCSFSPVTHLFDRDLEWSSLTASAGGGTSHTDVDRRLALSQRRQLELRTWAHVGIRRGRE